jgi:hypothetical protein
MFPDTCWHRYFYLALVYGAQVGNTSPRSGGRSVGLVRSRTQTMEFFFFFFFFVWNSWPKFVRTFQLHPVCYKVHCSTDVVALPLRVMCKAWRAYALDGNEIIRMRKRTLICYIMPTGDFFCAKHGVTSAGDGQLDRREHRNTNGPWPTCG